METQPNSPRFLYWLVGVLAVVLVAGVIYWFYTQNLAGTETTSQTDSTPTTTTDPVDSSGTEIDASVADLDADLASIDQDLASTDDEIPSL